MRSIFATVVFAAFSLAACAAKEPIPGEPVDRTYTLYVGEWENGDVTMLDARVINTGVRVGFCGAFARAGDGYDLERVTKEMLASGALIVGGVRMVTNLQFFADMGDDITLASGLANCVATTIPWRAGYATAELSFHTRTHFYDPATGK